MCVRARASACACACALLLALVLADQEEHADLSPMPFMLSTRYGRSLPAERHLVARTDRFVLSARYGKRAARVAGGAGEVGGAGRMLLCEFTGVFPLYRCRHKPPAPPALDAPHVPRVPHAYRRRSPEEMRDDD